MILKLIRVTVSCLMALVPISAWADQITLKNGDRVTGTIVKKDGGTLTIKSTVMGLITVPWDRVNEVRSDAPLNVVLPSGTVQSTVATSDGKRSHSVK
jgi:hypothetical protein